MIRVTANTENTLWVNASRNKTLSSPTYMMSINHQVNENFKKYFIPQNVTPQSGTTITNPRADLFNITFSGSGENLTGGTRAWYYTNSPNYLYDDERLKGTGKSYPKMNNWTNSFNFFTVQFDWSDTNDRMDDVNDTGFTVNINDQLFTGSPVVIRQPEGGGTDEGRIALTVATSPVPLEDIYKISYTGTTTGGTSMSNTIYVANGLMVEDAEPWTYYGETSLVARDYPITYLGKTIVEFEDYGWYYYKIYEQTSKINLNPTFTTDVVDEGILYIIPPETTEVSYTGYSNNNITIYE